MGCCASAKPIPPQGQQKANPPQPVGANNPTQLTNNSPIVQAANPQAHLNPNNPVKANPSTAQVKNTEPQFTNPQANKYSIPNANGNHNEAGVRNERKGVEQFPQVSSQLQNENANKLVQLHHVSDLASNSKGNVANSRVPERVHGQQQVLQTYHQNFEIPIFQVGLAAH